MAIVSLTEHNRNSSRVLRLADNEDVLVTDRGVPTYRITRVAPKIEDRLEALIRSGVFSPPKTARNPVTSTLTRDEARAAVLAYEAEEDGHHYEY